MSKVVDERVVEMRFDNKQFEEGVKKTTSTLKKFKEALKFSDTSKALDNVEKSVKNIKLNGLVSAVDQLNKRFSTFGVVGMTVIQNVTNGLLGTLNRAVNMVTNSIVSGGIKRAMNIENAHFQLQALLKDETKVQAIMADAMESVDGTAYAYDEAARAASQFAASGLKAGDEMLGALKGITGVAAMTNSSFESISQIFTTVAGNGRLMGDQLLQLSSRGLNVASTLSDYFRKVRKESEVTEEVIRKMVTKGELDFKTFADAMTWAFGDSAKRANETFNGAMSNMKSALARIGAGFVSPLVEQNGELVKLFNALRIKINEVKSELVFDEQRSAIEGLAEKTGLTEKRLTKMFERVKKDGNVSIKQLQKLGKYGASSMEALTRYVNGVTNGTVRATYSTKTAIDALTKGQEVSKKKIRKYVKAGKIDLAMFTSAMEHSYGTEKTLTKQFTDFFLDSVQKITKGVENMDISKPMDLFYKGLDAAKNVTKGFLTVLQPMNAAFQDVFSLDFGTLDRMADSLVNVTSKMKLSEKGSQDLQDTFKGLFDFAHLVIKVLADLVGAILPIEKPLVDTGSTILDLTGTLGRALSSFSETTEKSERLGKSISFIGNTVKNGTKNFASLVRILAKLLKQVVKFKPVTKTIDLFGKGFEFLGKTAAPYTDKFKDAVLRLVKAAGELETSSLGRITAEISKSFQKLMQDLKRFDFSKVFDPFKKLGSSLKEFHSSLSENEGVSTFAENLSKYGDALKDAVNLDSSLARFQNIMKVIGNFITWVKNTFGPAFEEFNFGSAATIAGFLGIVGGLNKAASSFQLISKSFSKIPSLLTTMGDALTAYQNKMKAETLKSIAEAIGILAGALLLLSFADQGNLMSAATALGIAGGALITSFAKLKEATAKGNDAVSALNTFSEGAKSLMTKFGKSLEIRALGAAIRDFSISIGIITASVIALGLMYEHDKAALEAGAKGVAAIIAVAVGVMAIMSKISLSKEGSGDAAKTLALGLLAFSASLYLMVSSLDKLMKMEIPPDWLGKLAILGALIGALGLLLVVVAGASSIAGDGSVSLGSLIGTAALLYIAVVSLEKLFKMELPNDTGTKVAIFLALFAGLSLMLLALGKMSELAGSGGTGKGKDISSVGNLLLKTVASLMLLIDMPAKDLLKGAGTLALVIGAVAVALYAAGKVQTEESAKAISAMSGVLTTITASLSILSLIPWDQLLTAAAALDSVLLSMAATLYGASKIAGKDATVGVMTVLLAIAGITASLYFLAEQPWEGMLAGGTALGEVLLAMSGAMLILQNVKVDMGMIGSVLLGLVAVAGIAAILYPLAEQPWEGLLAAGTALSETMLALSAAFAIIATVGTLCTGIIPALAAFDLFIANLLAVLLALGALCQNEQVQQLLNVGGKVFVALGKVIGDFVGAILEGIIGGALAGLNSGIADLGTNLSLFMINAQPFFIGLQMITEQMVSNAGYLVAIIAALAVESLINGLTTLIGGGIADLGAELSEFGMSLLPFISVLTLFDETKVAAAQSLADLIMAITASKIVDGIAKFLNLGSDPMTKFADGLGPLGEGITSFCTSLTDLSKEDVEKAKTAAQIGSIIADMNKDIVGSGGFLQKLFGEKDLGKFGENLESYGKAVAKFVKSVSKEGITADAADNVAAIGKVMAQLDADLEPHGGVIAMFTGDQSLTGFGRQLTSFAESITKFIEDTKEIEKTDISGVAAATKNLTKVADEIPYTKSALVAAFSKDGDNSIDRFGEQLSDFADSLKEFLEKIDGTDYSPIDAFKTGMDKIISVAQSASGLNLDNLINLTNFGGNANYDGLKSYVEGISAFQADASAQTQKVTDAIINVLRANYEGYKTAGTSSMNFFLQGFKSHYSNITETIDNIITTIRSKYESFKSAGNYMGQGFVEGIKLQNQAAENAGAELANRADKGARKKGQVKSPSRLMMKVGNYMGLGFILGFRKFVNQAYQEGMLLGESATKGTKYGMRNLSRITSDVEFRSPIITPRADLSQLQNSANQVFRMFNRAIGSTAILAGDVQVKMNGRRSPVSILEENMKSLQAGLTPRGDTYNINGIDYSESSDIGEALQTIMRVAKIKRRV